jgi:hypothetical protein
VQLLNQHRGLCVLLLLPLLGACDRLMPQGAVDAKFELRQDEKGRVIRLNKVTGEIAVIRDGKPVPIAKSDPESPSSRPSPNVSSPSTPSFSRAVNGGSPAKNSGSPTMARSVAPPVERITVVAEAEPSSPTANVRTPDGTTVKIKSTSPLFLFPDPRRTPLLMMPPGSVVKVLGIEGDWYRIEFNDQYIGPRIGYVSRQNVSADDSQFVPQDLSIVSKGNQLEPMDLSVPTSSKTMEPVDLSMHDQKPKDKASEPVDLSIKIPK